eukprot:s111_g52.t1
MRHDPNTYRYGRTMAEDMSDIVRESAQDIEPQAPVKPGKDQTPVDPGETPIFRLVRMGLMLKAEVELRKLGHMPNGLNVNVGELGDAAASSCRRRYVSDMSACEEKFGWGLLHFACHKGEAGLAQWLLKQKARTDVTDAEGNTPLVLCAKSNHVQAMELLMARGASITQRTKEQNFTPLLWAAAGGHFQATKSKSVLGDLQSQFDLAALSCFVFCFVSLRAYERKAEQVFRTCHVKTSDQLQCKPSYQVVGNDHTERFRCFCSLAMAFSRSLLRSGTHAEKAFLRPRSVSFISRNLAVISESRLDEFMRAELSIFAKQRPPQPLSFLDVIKASSCLEGLAQLVHQELPVRFARRLKHIERVDKWEQIPELVDLHAMHIHSFRELRLSDPSKPAEYAEAILQIRQRHKRLPRLFAEAVKRIASINEAPSETEEKSHFEACVKTAGFDEETKVGIIDMKCDPWQICESAVDGPYPCHIETESPPEKIEFCHVPRYLYYIMEEILSNSARAAAEKAHKATQLVLNSDGAEPSPIRVSLCADDSQVVIRISDRAGGMHSKCANEVWSYLFTTSPVHAASAQRVEPHRPWGVDGHGESPMAGRGIGLPLCRLYAMYLGASLHLMILDQAEMEKERQNMPGLGVDAYLFLNRRMQMNASVQAIPTCFDGQCEADADVEDRDFEDRTPLMWAARHGHLNVVKLLLRLCPDLTHRDKQGFAALDQCREHLEMRAAVIMAQEQCIRLADGAQRNDLQAVVEHLLERGAMPRYKDAGGWTPLTWAVLHGSAEMAHVLVRYGASPELLGEDSELGSQLSRKGRQVSVRLAAVLGANSRLLDAAQASNFTAAEAALDQGA